MSRRLLVTIAIYALLLIGGWYAGAWLMQWVDFEASTIMTDASMMTYMILFVLAIYILTSALPFVPGAEIGFSMVLLFGGRVALLVYFGMVSALIISFMTGRFVPLPAVAKLFKSLGLTRAYDLIMKLVPLTPQQRLALLTDNAPRRFVPQLVRYRYLLLVLLFNMPGNSIIGGGGGIAFIAGLSRLFSIPIYIAIVAVAVAPVPLFFYLV